MVDTPIHEIIYCAPESSYPDLSECQSTVRFIDSLPDKEMFEDKRPRLLIVDDWMAENNGSLVNFFTKYSHHLSVSVIFICQNIFYKGKGQRDISLNSHYIVVYKNPRDRNQFGVLAQQVNPQNVTYMKEIFTDATANAYGYLLLDLTQTTPDHLRFRTKIFPNEYPSNIIYVPKTYNV